MLMEKDFSEIPSFIIVKERIHAENPDVEIVRVKLDQSTVNYVFELMNGAGLRLSKELLDDLPGKNNDHRNAQLDQKIRGAIDRKK
jgi:hypothetical protein